MVVFRIALTQYGWALGPAFYSGILHHDHFFTSESLFIHFSLTHMVLGRTA